MVQATLLKPLDGQPIGATIELSQLDFDRLKAKGAVAAVKGKAEPKSEPAPANKMAKAPANKSKGK